MNYICGKKKKKKKEEIGSILPLPTASAVSPNRSTDTLTDAVREVKAFLDDEILRPQYIVASMYFPFAAKLTSLCQTHRQLLPLKPLNNLVKTVRINIMECHSYCCVVREQCWLDNYEESIDGKRGVKVKEKKRTKTKKSPHQQPQLQNKLIVRGQVLLLLNSLAGFPFISIGLINTCIPPASVLPESKAGRQSINMSYKESAQRWQNSTAIQNKIQS